MGMRSRTLSGESPEQTPKVSDLAALLREGGPETLVYRATEVSKLLKLSRAKIYEMAAAGILPSIKVGRSIRIPAAALERWLEANTREGE